MSTPTLYGGGPAYATYNSLTLKMREDWKISNPDQFFEIPSATGVGESKGLSDKRSTLSFHPKVLKTNLASLFSTFCPWNDPAKIGSQIAPATDLPFVVHARNGGTSNLGISLTYNKAVLSKMPKLTFAHDKPLFGPIEMQLLVASGSAVGDAGKFLTEASAAYAEPGWSIADELFDKYTLTLGALGTNASPFTVICDKDGIEFNPTANIEWIQPQGQPTQDGKLAKVTAEISFRPWNMDADTWLSTYFPEETGQSLGASIETGGFQANIVGAKSGGANLKIPCVTRAKSSFDFSTKSPRLDKVTLQAVQYYDTSVWDALWTLGVNS